MELTRAGLGWATLPRQLVLAELASGELVDGTKVDGVVSLRSALLRQPELFVGTVVEKLMTYALGRGIAADDMPAVRDIIRELHQGGTAVFLNSHLLGEVEATCDRVVFVKEGRTVRELSLAEVPTEVEVELRLGPMSPETVLGLRRFGRAMPAAGDAVEESAGADQPVPAANGNGLIRMRIEGDHVLPEIARWLVERQVPLYEMRTARKPLEAWFLEIIGGDQRPG